MGMSLVLEYLDLMMVLRERLRNCKVVVIHPEIVPNFMTIQNCGDVSHRTTNANLAVALKEKSGDSVRIHLLRNMNICTKFHENPVKSWVISAHWPTDWPPLSPIDPRHMLAWLKIMHNHSHSLKLFKIICWKQLLFWVHRWVRWNLSLHCQSMQKLR